MIKGLTWIEYISLDHLLMVKFLVKGASHYGQRTTSGADWMANLNFALKGRSEKFFYSGIWFGLKHPQVEMRKQWRITKPKSFMNFSFSHGGLKLAPSSVHAVPPLSSQPPTIIWQDMRAACVVPSVLFRSNSTHVSHSSQNGAS